MRMRYALRGISEAKDVEPNLKIKVRGPGLTKKAPPSGRREKLWKGT